MRIAFSQLHVIGTPIWTNNADRSADVTFVTNRSGYVGIGYGIVSGVYTKSAFEYVPSATPSEPDLEYEVVHTIHIPDVLFTLGVEDAADFYWRIWGAISGDPIGDWIDDERTGTITGTPLVPSDISGLWAWCRKGVGISGSPNVTSWADQSGNGRNFVAANSPQLQGNGTVLFGGTNQYIVHDEDLPQPFTIIARFKNITTSENEAWWGGNNNNTAAYQTTPDGSVGKLYAGTDFVCTNTSIAAIDTYITVVTQFNGASSFIRVGGEGNTTGDPGSASMDGVCMAACVTQGTWSNIQLAEFAIYDEAVSEEDLNALVYYMDSVI